MMEIDLHKFQDSEEEGILQKCLKDLTIQKRVYINLVIESCNVKKAVPFTSADFVLFPFCEHGFPKQPPRIVRFEKLLNTELLEKLAEEGVGAAPEECKSAVLCLMEFLRGRVHA
jgi:hypothetical protein